MNIIYTPCLFQKPKERSKRVCVCGCVRAVSCVHARVRAGGWVFVYPRRNTGHINCGWRGKNCHSMIYTRMNSSMCPPSKFTQPFLVCLRKTYACAQLEVRKISSLNIILILCTQSNAIKGLCFCMVQIWIVVVLMVVIFIVHCHDELDPVAMTSDINDVSITTATRNYKFTWKWGNPSGPLLSVKTVGLLRLIRIIL